METSIPLQEILGVDSKNPYFTICKHWQQPDKLQVYFGAGLLEVVEGDRCHPSFKLLLARLYNSGFKVKTLTDTFCVPYSTLRRWAEALKSGDTEKLMRVLAGRQHPRKLTPEILSFVQQRFNDIYPKDIYTYSKQIREEIVEVFDVSISGERLRPYFSAWKQRLKAAFVAAQKASDVCGEPPESVHEKMGSSVVADAGQHENNRLLGQVASQEQQTKALGEDNRKQTVVLGSEDRKAVSPLENLSTSPDSESYHFCHHAGIVLFSAFLTPLEKALGEGGILIKQWLVAVLLGAINIEQSKLLSWDALRLLLGDVVVNLNKQRQSLGELASATCLKKLLQVNGNSVSISLCHDFYYDPHSKHYTGAHKILKGWCSRLRFAEKVLHMDFIHTALGFPVYIAHEDNFYDLRERFLDVVNGFRDLFGFDQHRVLTFVIDRGIYGIDVFEKILKDKAKTYFVTWEKGYKSDRQENIAWTNNFNLYKGRNSSKDQRRYTFYYYDESWPGHETLRRLIVKATNPKGNTIQVSILTNDLQRAAQELIELMFSRWIQENDFKYLDTHFGINEITSYDIFSYQQLERMDETIKDRQIKSGAYKALEKQRKSIKNKLKTRLLRDHCSKKESAKRQQEIAALTQQLDVLEGEMTQTDKETSRLNSLVEEGFYKLDTSKKSFMDGIKITARNQFYLLLQPFKEAYDNYRDDHVLFRHLTRSSGLIRNRGDCVEVLLFPQANFPPKVIGIIGDLLDQLNNRRLTMPNNSGKTIQFGLLQNNKTQFEIKPKVCQLTGVKR